MSAMLKYPDESDKPAAHHHHLRLQDDDQVSGAGDHVHDSNPIQQMFSDVMNGLPPAMSTAMFQHSIQSVKQLSTVLMDFFKHGLSYNQVNCFAKFFFLHVLIFKCYFLTTSSHRLKCLYLLLVSSTSTATIR